MGAYLIRKTSCRMLESLESRDSSHRVPRHSRTFVGHIPKGQRKLSFYERTHSVMPDPLQFNTRGRPSVA